MKKICFFIKLFLIISISTAAQLHNDSASMVKKMLPDSIKYFPLCVVPPNYYASNLGFFCKKELQMQKSVKMPVKFRLGTVEYCDKIEGKLTTPH